MSRTYRCKSTAPTGTIVRDGYTECCFDEYNTKFWCSPRHHVEINGMSIFGISNEVLIERINARPVNTLIYRGLPRWRSRKHIDCPKLRQQFKTISSRHERRRVQGKISDFVKYEISHEDFDLHPSRPFMEIQ